jgi:hypothetical protein
MPLLLNLFAQVKAWWPWLRWVLAVLAVLFATLTFTQLGDYLAASIAQHRLGKQVTTTMRAHDARQRVHQQASRAADSTYFLLDGQRRESEAHAHALKQAYDAQAATLPTAPALPASPQRQ